DEQEAFTKRLSRQMRSRRAERKPDCGLRAPPGGACKHQACDVGAHHQQQQAGSDSKQPQRASELVAKDGDSAFERIELRIAIEEPVLTWADETAPECDAFGLRVLA